MTRLVVKITTAAADLERCNQGWTVATMGIAAGASVSVWLTGDAVRFATPGFAASLRLEGAQPFEVAVATLLADGTVTACSQCLERRGIGPSDVMDGVRIAGAAGFVEEILTDGTQALVY